MNDTENTIKYVTDADVLINFGHWCPEKYHNDFWNKMENALREKKWILLDVVVDEVKYPPDLKKWVKKRKQEGLVVSIGDDVREKAVTINNTYPMIDESTGKSTTDTYIIAFASKEGCHIFTREGYRKASADLFKIPEVCENLDIQFIRNPVAFLNAIF